METELTSSCVQKNLLESALFMATKPLALDELMRISGIGSLGYLKDMIKVLQKDYTEKSLEIIETPEGWQMKVKKEYLPRVASLTPHADLSDGCKKTIALVLYHEPLKQSELVKTQGTKAYVYVKELEKRGLLKAERKGHTKILKITSEFENYFGETKEEIKKRLAEAMERMDSPLEEKNSGESKEIEKLEKKVDIKAENLQEKLNKAERELANDDESLAFSLEKKRLQYRVSQSALGHETSLHLKRTSRDADPKETKIQKGLAEDDNPLPFSFLNKIHDQKEKRAPKETKIKQDGLTEDDEALEQPKNLKPIKRENPVKVKIKKDVQANEKTEKRNNPVEASKPINKVVAKQNLSGVKELTLEDLKK